MTTRAFHARASIFKNGNEPSFPSRLDVVRRWLTVGTGIGIEIRGPNLKILVVRLRPKGPAVVGHLEVRAFDERPPDEWGGEYKTFLRELGVARIGAVMLLPREGIICRTIKLPGVKDRLIPAALKFEVDSLFPWAREEPVYDWARIGRSSSILVAMTRRCTIQRYTTLFEHADIKISHFTCDAAALHSSFHMFRHSYSDGFFAIGGEQGELVLYGESPSIPLFSAYVDMSFERACSLAVAELRLNPGAEPIAINELAPAALPGRPSTDPATWSMAYVTALCGANPYFAQTLNLLPRDQRQGILRTVYMPTIVLVMLLFVALGVLAWFSTTLTREYYRRAVLAAIETVEPQARVSDDLDRRIGALRQRAQTINAFRMRSKDDMDAFTELTQLITPPTWLHSLLLTRQVLLLTGEAEQAATLLKVIDSSIQFNGSQFSSPVAREGRLEGFGIRAKRRAINHEAY